VILYKQTAAAVLGAPHAEPGAPTVLAFAAAAAAAAEPFDNSPAAEDWQTARFRTKHWDVVVYKSTNDAVEGNPSFGLSSRAALVESQKLMILVFSCS
jgi:hypothetical protein